VTHIDYQLGHLMQRLQRELREEAGNPLWLFTSDHGDMLGDHHLHRKCYAYEGSARIPLVVRYPRGLDLPTGSFGHVVGLQDVMPTLLEAAGVAVPESVLGTSLLGAIRGEAGREWSHGEHSPCYSMEQAMQYLTDGREKYIYLPFTGEEQLFDLVTDRDELHDLARDPANAERVALWRQRLIDILEPRGDGFVEDGKLAVRRERWGPVVEG